MFFAATRRVWLSVIFVSLSLSLAARGVALARKGIRAWKPAAHAKTAPKAPNGDTDPIRASSSGTPHQRGKVVLFPFRNDDDAEVSKHVGLLLKARGLEVVTGVRPVDSAEQYREMATHLMLVGYVDGTVRGTGAKAKVTVRLRSGYSGRIVAQPAFVDSRGNLRHELGEKLWKRLGPPVARVCKQAAKPRKRSRTTLTIDAGTPIETTPRDPPPAAPAKTASAPAPTPKASATSATTWVDPFAD
jgi:hypothetical protein